MDWPCIYVDISNGLILRKAIVFVTLPTSSMLSFITLLMLDHDHVMSLQLD